MEGWDTYQLRFFMKIRCSREALLKPLAISSGITGSKDIFPICEYVRISALQSKLIIRSTDLKVAMTYQIPASDVVIEEEGEVLLAVKKLDQLLQNLKNEKEVLLETRPRDKSGKHLAGILHTPEGEIELYAEDIQKFPEIPELKEQDSIELEGKGCLDLIRKSLFCTTKEKTRYDLNNVLIQFEEEGIVRFVATDGKRLAYCRQPYKTEKVIAKSRYMVPSYGLQQIEKALGTITPPKVKLGFASGNHLLLRTDNLTLSTRMADATFPPYEKVLPQGFPYRAKISVSRWLDMLRRVMILTDKTVLLKFAKDDSGKGILSISIEEKVTGKANFSISIEYDGDPMQIRFNPELLKDALSRMDSALTIEVEIKDCQSALFMKEGEGFHYLALPIRMENEADEGENEDEESSGDEEPSDEEESTNEEESDD